jgi:hypothetical protein
VPLSGVALGRWTKYAGIPNPKLVRNTRDQAGRWVCQLDKHEPHHGPPPIVDLCSYSTKEKKLVAGASSRHRSRRLEGLIRTGSGRHRLTDTTRGGAT